MKAFAAIVLLVVFVSACGGDSPPAAQRAQDPPPQPRATVPPPRVMPVEIISVSPETIDVRGGRAVPTTFTIEYRIANPEKISEAELRIQSSGFGVLQRQPVPVQPSGIVTMAVDPRQDFGPIVRFRVLCPSGTTEWRTLGELRDSSAPRADSAGGVALTSVSPSEIRPSYDGSMGGGVSIGLLGTGFTNDCTIEGQRDGSPIQLSNPYLQSRTLRTVLPHAEIDNRPVARRYIEFGLSIRGPGVGQIHHKIVPFNE